MENNFHESNFGHEEISQEVDYVRPIKQDYSQCPLLKNYSNDKSANHIKLSLNESKKLSCCNFSALPVKYFMKSIFHNNIYYVISCNKVLHFIFAG